MSATTPEPQAPTTPAPPAEPAAPAQEPTDWKAEARKWEDRAKANAEKAKQFDEVTEASKSDLQKVIDRATKAEAEAAALPAKVSESLRKSLVALGVVAKEDEVLLTASDPDALLAQVKRLGERSDTRRKGGNVVPREGSNPTKSDADSDMREFARNLFASGE